MKSKRNYKNKSYMILSFRPTFVNWTKIYNMYTTTFMYLISIILLNMKILSLLLYI